MRGTEALTLGRALKSTDNRLAFPRLKLLKALALLRCQGLIPHASYSDSFPLHHDGNSYKVFLLHVTENGEQMMINVQPQM